MTATRSAIRSFAAGIALSVGTRLWATTPLPYGGGVFWGGLLLGALAWSGGAYYGYRAVRNGGRDGRRPRRSLRKPFTPRRERIRA